jgi:hypothetical protein
VAASRQPSEMPRTPASLGDRALSQGPYAAIVVRIISDLMSYAPHILIV